MSELQLFASMVIMSFVMFLLKHVYYYFTILCIYSAVEFVSISLVILS